MQKSVKNNKKHIINTSLAGLVGGPVSALAAATASKIINKNSKQDPGILDKRKNELLQQLERFTGSCVQKHAFIGQLTTSGLQSLLEQEPPITLAFQKLDDQHLLCMNTGEKIAV